MSGRPLTYSRADLFHSCPAEPCSDEDHRFLSGNVAASPMALGTSLGVVQNVSRRSTVHHRNCGPIHKPGTIQEDSVIHSLNSGGRGGR